MNHCLRFETNYSSGTTVTSCCYYLMMVPGPFSKRASVLFNQLVPIRDYLSSRMVKRDPHVPGCQICLLRIGKHQQLFCRV